MDHMENNKSIDPHILTLAHLFQFLSNPSLKPVIESFAHPIFVLVAIVQKIFGLKIILTQHFFITENQKKIR